MAKICEICGKGPQFGNRVSHANNRTADALNQTCKLFEPLLMASPNGFASALAV
jgi:ribosomal protein L28